jgi:hypothetical protein
LSSLYKDLRKVIIGGVMNVELGLVLSASVLAQSPLYVSFAKKNESVKSVVPYVNLTHR